MVFGVIALQWDNNVPNGLNNEVFFDMCDSIIIVGRKPCDGRLLGQLGRLGLPALPRHDLRPHV